MLIVGFVCSSNLLSGVDKYRGITYNIGNGFSGSGSLLKGKSGDYQYGRGLLGIGGGKFISTQTCQTSYSCLRN